jgi:hypothetical protein
MIRRTNEANGDETVSGIVNAIIKVPLDKAGASIMRQLSRPMGAVGAGTAGAVTGILVAHSVSRGEPLSVETALSVGGNVVVGAAMLGVGAAYAKPYFASLGKVTLGATAAGVGAGMLSQGAGLLPDITVTVDRGR